MIPEAVNAILTSWWWAHVLETCRGLKWTYCKTNILFIKLVNYWDKLLSLLSHLAGYLNYVPGMNYTARIHKFAAVPYLQFLIHVMLFRTWNIFCTFTLKLTVICVQCPIWLFFFLHFLNLVFSSNVARVLSEWFWNESSSHYYWRYYFCFHIPKLLQILLQTRKIILLANLSLCLDLRTGENVLSKLLVDNKHWYCRSQWPCGLRRGSVAPRLLGLRVRIPPLFGFLSPVSIVCCQVEVLV